jgi:hypothetical protein
MRESDSSDAVRESLEKVLPPVLGQVEDLGVRFHVVDNAFHDGVEELLATGHIPVQRHRLDSEQCPETAHRQARKPLVVDERDRGVDDPVSAQRDTLRGRCLASDDRGICVGRSLLGRVVGPARAALSCAGHQSS